MTRAKPSGEKPGEGPSWDALHQLAAAQSGYFSAHQATEAGFSDQLLHKHAQNGTLERPRRGVYRIARFPPSEHEDLVVFWLWSSGVGVFSHETALQLHGLSDALPARIHMTLPVSEAKRKRTIPDELVLHYADVEQRERMWMGPIPVTAPTRTVLDVAAAHGDPMLVEQAVNQGCERRMFTAIQVAEAAMYVKSFDVGFATRVRPTKGLGDFFHTMALSGTPKSRPPADWPNIARTLGEAYGAQLYVAEPYRGTTMFLEYVWPETKAPSADDRRKLRRAVTKEFSWAS